MNTFGCRFHKEYYTAALFLTACAMAGCVSAPGTAVPPSAASTSVPSTFSIPTPTESQSSVTPHITGYEFPASIDPAGRYLFYLHGKIIEDQGLPAVSPDYGEYEYASILKTLESHGFVVISEQRPKDTDADAYAQRVLGQIGLLLKAHVPPGNITVVGASKGGYIAATVSHLLEGAMVNFVLMGTCDPGMVDDWKLRQMSLHGNVLEIYDSVDEYAGSCQELFAISEGKGLGRHQEIVLHVGTGHGILYQPLDEWILPTVEWAGK
jgi:hypothetical protein